ncbi:hypothetical protein [Gilliamella sp. M0364]
MEAFGFTIGKPVINDVQQSC